MNKWIFSLIALIINVISPELRIGLESWLDDLDEKAKATSNPWDDMLVALLKSVLLNK